MIQKEKRLTVSLGIFAHNEEKNIEKLLKSIAKQRTKWAKIEEIWVISSGSNDLTNRLVRKWMKQDKRVKLMEEVARGGKSVAINHFIQRATRDVLITISADLRLHAEAIEELVMPLQNFDVGMVGARPKPSNSRSSKIGAEIELLWELHHQISLIRPKCGEMVAFRNVIRKIPPDSAVDEATLEVLLSIVGYAVVYAPRAVVYNKGPIDMAEYVAQRRRVYAGHQWVSQKYNYQVVTMQWQSIIQVVLANIIKNPSKIRAMINLILMEITARWLGWFDYHVLNKNPFVWKMISR